MYLVERSGRPFVPIPKVFIQNPDRRAPLRGAPLADFVRRKDKRGLIALLLLHSVISSGDGPDGWSSTLPLKVWARALNTVSTATGSSATSAATKIFTRLVERHLIERRRSGRERKITLTLLNPDGSGRPYVRPKGTTDWDRFVRLSHHFWADGWDETLTLPGIAMLLVALHEKPTFPLPTEKMPKWYGWSADTAERGMRQLADHGLMSIEKEYYADPLSPTGVAARNLYTVQRPFDTLSVELERAVHTAIRR